MSNRLFVALSIYLGTTAIASAAESGHEAVDRAAMFASDDINWVAGPPSLPTGAMIAVLEGDPNKEGPFVFRVKVPHGYRIPPHTHPKLERITVISGTFHIGMGDTFDERAARAMPAGSYGYWPAGMKHFVWAEGETIVQFHGEGPWTINYVNEADDPRKIASRTPVEFTNDTLAEIKLNVDEGKAVLVDVRSQEEWSKGHLKTSIFLPVTSLQKHSLDRNKVAETLPKDKVIYTFCVVGMRAKAAAKALSQFGYDARPLKPGYDELHRAGFK